MIKGLTGYAKVLADTKQTSIGNRVHYHPEEAERMESEALLAAAAAGDASGASKGK
jgi:hypothetical protein